jgi:hypothetical protein
MPIELEPKKPITEDAQKTSDTNSESEHGTVKKKIEIPGMGEIEYTEKRIMFPEKIVQETGGVKGYIRKMVSWDNLANFLGVSLEEMNKMKANYHDAFKLREKLKKENEERVDEGIPPLWSQKEIDETFDDERLPLDDSRQKYEKVGGILPIISAMTKGEFIKETFNHIVGGYINISRKKTISKDCVLDKFLDLELRGEKIKRSILSDFRAYDIKTNDMLEESRTMDHEQLIKQYQDGTLSKETYLMKEYGLSLTDCSLLWKGQKLEKNEIESKNFFASDPRSQNTPFLYDIVVGFKPNTQNSVLKEYCSSVLKIMKERYPGLDSKIDESDAFPSRLRIFQRKVAMETLGLLFKNKKTDKKGPKMTDLFKLAYRSPDEHGHPLIPIVINHPDIPELRWCHADYAAIPTKNGYNIIEMIT